MMMANDIRPEASRERLLDVKGLTIEIETRRGPATIVDGIDLHVDKGETLGIVGESGCGKSLTMLSLMRLLPNKIRVTQGEANFAGQSRTISADSPSVSTPFAIHSVSIKPGERWQICANREFRAPCTTVTRPIADARLIGVTGQVGSIRQVPDPNAPTN